MHQIHFYKNQRGERPVADYIKSLSEKNDKDSRIKLNKVLEYIRALSRCGTRLGEKYVKHIEGRIWELRPLRDRVLFVGWTDGGFVLLHPFVKKTQKTPRKEIEQAKRELADLMERGLDEDG